MAAAEALHREQLGGMITPQSPQPGSPVPSAGGACFQGVFFNESAVFSDVVAVQIQVSGNDLAPDCSPARSLVQ